MVKFKGYLSYDSEDLESKVELEKRLKENDWQFVRITKQKSEVWIRKLGDWVIEEVRTRDWRR